MPLIVKLLLLQKKDPLGDSDELPSEVVSDLYNLTKEKCEPLTISQVIHVERLTKCFLSSDHHVPTLADQEGSLLGGRSDREEQRGPREARSRKG